METLAANVTHFFLQKHYIEPDQAEWFQYGLASRMMGCLTFLLLLPAGALFVGWISSFLYLYTFRFFANADGRLPRQNAARLPAGLAWHHVRGVDPGQKSSFAASHRRCFVCCSPVHFCAGTREQRFTPLDSQ